MSVKRDLLRLRRGCHQDHRGRNGDQSNDTSHDLSPPFPSISTHIERRPDDHKLGNRGMVLPSPSRLIHRSAWKASACWKTPSVPTLTPNRALDTPYLGLYGASGARFVVTFASAPTFPTGCQA